jgi:hypothetical protein
MSVKKIAAFSYYNEFPGKMFQGAVYAPPFFPTSRRQK